jgi:Tol biopolymer transport system component
MLRFSLIIIWIVTLSCGSTWAQVTTRVSVDSAGAQSNGYSFGPSFSADGRWLVFFSYASNLVPADTNGSADIFVHDLQTGATTRVSVDSSGAQGSANSDMPSISSDGRYVAFESLATNLVAGDTNNTWDVFVHDRMTGATTRVSVDSSGAEGNGPSRDPAISSDGRYVTFDSTATNLVTGDTNGATDVFVHDLLTGATTRVSTDSSGTQGNGDSSNPAASSDGRYIAFVSAAGNLVNGDTNGTADVFVHDRVTGATSRASVDSNGAQANAASSQPSISSDGRYIAFASAASNLVPADTNGVSDIFVHDAQSGITTRISMDSNGVQGNVESEVARISSDGRYVTFDSFAFNLVPGDTNGTRDAFVHDRLSGATSRMSLDSNGVQGNADSFCGALSSDARYAAFYSLASNLVTGDTNGTSDVFVRDRGPASSLIAFCFGDGSGGACPCGNAGATGHGCQNSVATGGALVTASGVASLSADTVALASSGELPTALSIVLQGDTWIAPVVFGDGLRCAGGTLKRLYVKSASGGSTSAPQTGDPAISARSAALGDTIPLGATRIYQVYYRDANLVFCAGGFNVSTAIAIAWGS